MWGPKDPNLKVVDFCHTHEITSIKFCYIVISLSFKLCVSIHWPSTSTLLQGEIPKAISG